MPLFGDKEAVDRQAKAEQDTGQVAAHVQRRDRTAAGRDRVNDQIVAGGNDNALN